MTKTFARWMLAAVLGFWFATAAAAAQPMLAHNVYFRLVDNSTAAQEQLVAACNKYLSGHPGTVFFAAGTLAADCDRSVNDRDFDVALHLVFANKAAHDRYAKAKRHLAFIKENEANWKQVRVFDSYVGQPPQTRSMLYAGEAKGSVDEVAGRLEEAVAANKFGVLGVHDLKAKMNAKGVAFGSECRVFEVCNPRKAKTVLETDMSLSGALPCRISVYEQGGKVIVSTMRPTAILALFGRPGLEPVAEEVEQTMIRIIDAACQQK